MRINLTAGLKAALKLIEAMQPSNPEFILAKEQALEALPFLDHFLRESLELRDELAQSSQLLSDVGIGKAQWKLPARLTLLSYWMRSSPTNARLLAALAFVEPYMSRLANRLSKHMGQHGYPDQYNEAQAEQVLLIAQELKTFMTWQSPPPNIEPPPLVRIRITGPARVLKCPDWIKIEFVGNEPEHSNPAFVGSAQSESAGGYG